MENTSSLGELNSAIPGPDDVVPRNYTTLFPNVSVSYSDQENHALSVSIGRRITRPNYQDLNPFERKLVISDTYSVTTNFFANIFNFRMQNNLDLFRRA